MRLDLIGASSKAKGVPFFNQLGPDEKRSRPYFDAYDVRGQDELAKTGGGASKEKQSPEEIKRLTAALNDPNIVIRCNAAYALGKIGKGASSAVPELITALKEDSSGFVRFSAAWALGELGKEASSAVPELTAASKEDSSRFVRSEAKRALTKIQRDLVQPYEHSSPFLL